MEAIGLREVERQVVSQDTMPQLGFRPRDDIVGLRQLLNVVRPLDQRIVVELFGADPEHVQDDLRVLRIVLVPAIVQRFPGPGETDRRDELRLEPGRCQVVGQSPVIVTGRLECDADGKIVLRQQRDQPVELGAGVENCQTPTSRLPGRSDQNLVAVLGDIDAYEDGVGSCRMLSGHGRSPLRCGSCRTTVETRGPAMAARCAY